MSSISGTIRRMSLTDRRARAASRSTSKAFSSLASSGLASGSSRLALAMRPFAVRLASRTVVGEVVLGVGGDSLSIVRESSGSSSIDWKAASIRSRASVRCDLRNRSHRVVDGHLAGQAGEPLGRGHLEDPAEVEVEPDDDLVAGVDGGQAFDQELADQGVVPGILVLALEDADVGGFLAVGGGARTSRSGRRAEGCSAR